MDSNAGVRACRSCGAAVTHRILDLGRQPVADLLPTPDDPEPDAVYPLGLAVCDQCFLVQLAEHPPAVDVPHGHGEAFSSTVTSDIGALAAELLSSVAGSDGARMVAVGSLPDGLRDAFRASGWGTETVEHGREAATRFLHDHEQADLVLAHHELAHVDNLDDAIAGMALLRAPRGTVAIEAHYVLGIVTQAQFDVVGHAHRSYLSLASLEHALLRHGLHVSMARRVDAFGGSIRVAADDGGSRSDAAGDADLQGLRDAEQAAGLDRLDGYAGLDSAASAATGMLRAFLERCQAARVSVAGYGAPARGTTLLNAAGITPELLPFTVDRSPRKQGRALPGCRIPIHEPEAIDAGRPARILILPWPLRVEIEHQLSAARAWGARFVVALPELAVT